MILVDTSVWIDHLRSGDDGLTTLLNNSQVLMHPFVLGGYSTPIRPLIPRAFGH